MKGKNFNETEKEILLQTVIKFKSIIENKRTDSMMITHKNKAWPEIMKEYNSQQPTRTRQIKKHKNVVRKHENES